MSIKKQVFAKEKAYDVISSCDTIEQLEVAKKYVQNYFELYEDGLGFNRLMLEIEVSTQYLNSLTD